VCVCVCVCVRARVCMGMGTCVFVDGCTHGHAHINIWNIICGSPYILEHVK
jgi:hypothetical protein